MWTCPACGRRFVQRTLEHSCRVYALEDHYAGKPPAVVELCEAYLRRVEALGSVSIEPLKGSIMLRARTNFGAVRLQQNGLRCSLLLAQRPASPRISRVEPYGRGRLACQFLLGAPADIDSELLGWLSAAHALGTGI
jgi:hypothetical protein